MQQNEAREHRKRYFSSMMYDEYVDQFDHPPKPPQSKPRISTEIVPEFVLSPDLKDDSFDVSQTLRAKSNTMDKLVSRFDSLNKIKSSERKFSFLERLEQRLCSLQLIPAELLD